MDRLFRFGRLDRAHECDQQSLNRVGDRPPQNVDDRALRHGRDHLAPHGEGDRLLLPQKGCYRLPLHDDAHFLHDDDDRLQLHDDDDRQQQHDDDDDLVDDGDGDVGPHRDRQEGDYPQLWRGGGGRRAAPTSVNKI